MALVHFTTPDFINNLYFRLLLFEFSSVRNCFILVSWRLVQFLISEEVRKLGLMSGVDIELNENFIMYATC